MSCYKILVKLGFLKIEDNLRGIQIFNQTYLSNQHILSLSLLLLLINAYINRIYLSVCMWVNVRDCEKTVPGTAIKFHIKTLKTPECVHVEFGFSNFLLVFILLKNNYNFMLWSRDKVLCICLYMHTHILKRRGL